MRSFPAFRPALRCALVAALVSALGSCASDAPTGASPVRTVVVTVETPQIQVGGTTHAAAQVRDADGHVLPGEALAWTSLTPAVLGVSPTGEVTGLQAGIGTVRATSGAASGTATVTVKNPLAGAIRLSRDTATLFVPGGSLQTVAAVTDERGQPIANPAITWTSSQPLVASVNTLGLVTAVASGSTIVTGTIDGMTAAIAITVRPAPNANAPTVTAIAPAILRPGALYTVTGTNFAPTPGGNLVFVDGVSASVQTASPTQLTIALPATGFTCEPSRTAFLQVTVAGVPGGAATTLQVGVRRAFSPGQSVVVTDPAEVRCNELVPADGRWVVTPYNATRATVSPAAPGSIQFSLRGLTVPAAQAGALRATEGMPAFLRTGGGAPADVRESAHAEVLDRNLAALAAGARPAARLTVRAAPGGASRDLATPGAITTVKLPNLDAADFCVSNVPIAARTVFVGAHSVILEDTASTANGRATLKGQMDDYFTRIGNEFEGITWPILSAAFGNPLAMDAALGGPGRVVMVFSPRINAMQRGNVVGFVANCDLFPAAQKPSSNGGAFFYAITPTSTAAGYASPETRDQWMRIMRSTIIHEVRHLTSFAERTARGLPMEDASWEEGGARIAEEMFSRSIYGTVPRANMTYAQTLACDIRYLTTTPGCADRPLLMLRHFDGLYSYLSTPELYSPLGRTFSGEVAYYAAAWAFLRWAADHATVIESQFFRDFTTNPTVGAANIEARTGRAWEESLGEWTLAMYLDDAAGFAPIATRIRFPSWNLADIWAGLCADLGPCVNAANPVQTYVRAPPFLPKARTFGNFVFNFGTMAGGGFTVVDLSGSPAASQVIELRSLNGTADPPPTLRLAIARVR